MSSTVLALLPSGPAIERWWGIAERQIYTCTNPTCAE